MRARLVTPHSDDDLDVDHYSILAGGVLRLRLGSHVRLLAPGEWEDFVVDDPSAAL